MTLRLNPYLHFDGEAADALALYADVLGGSATSSTFGELGMEGEAATRIMHAQVDTDAGVTLMLGDMPPGSEHRRGNDVTIALSGDDAETLRGYWAGLSAGGQVETDLAEQAGGDEFGTCIDRFGVSWMVHISGRG